MKRGRRGRERERCKEKEKVREEGKGKTEEKGGAKGIRKERRATKVRVILARLLGALR